MYIDENMFKNYFTKNDAWIILQILQKILNDEDFLNKESY